jgi:hypothetical protein
LACKIANGNEAENERLCQLAVEAYVQPELAQRNNLILVAKPLLVRNTHWLTHPLFVKSLIESLIKPNFDMWDFSTAAEMLTELALLYPQLLSEHTFFDRLRKSLMTLELNRSEIDTTFHRVFLWILRLSAYALMSDRV